MKEMTRWQDIAPADAADINLESRTDITAPLNENGERCPWPWDPQRLDGAPIGQYHCPYCDAMCIAGMEHIDYAYVPAGWLSRPGVAEAVAGD
jgi:hypothetical protein